MLEWDYRIIVSFSPHSLFSYHSLDDHSRVVLSGEEDYVNANFITVVFIFLIRM